jgi:hypothetical protein
MRVGRVSPSGALWLLSGLLSLVAVLTGCWAAEVHGVPTQALALDMSAWVVGAALAASVARIRADLTLVWLALALAALVLTLFSLGLLGVHRWLATGPIRWNAAELLMPIALAACAGMRRESWLRLLFPLAAVVILALQPDASQASATAAASIVLLTTSKRPVFIRALVALATAIAVIVSALRPDPIGPVPQVEGIVLLAARLSPAVACLGVAAIAGGVLSPLWLACDPRHPARDSALVLTCYLALASLAPVVGAFPVPLMGIAVSPIIGFWLGLGWLMHIASPPTSQITKLQ